jgi:hypothetical protein
MNTCDVTTLKTVLPDRPTARGAGVHMPFKSFALSSRWSTPIFLRGHREHRATLTLSNEVTAARAGRPSGRTAAPAYVTALVACILTPACIAQTTVAQHAWEKIQMPTASEVAAAWKNPPSEYGPEPYYGLNGPVTIESVQHDLDTMKSLGFHAVTAQAGFSMKQSYLSPEYFAFFKQFAEEAKKRDIRVWIVDDAGYPSGFAGGKISTEKPELRMQALSLGQRYPVKAGGTLSQAVSANAVAAVASNASGERVGVPIANGDIAWTAPAGSDWTVTVVEHVFRTSPTRSDTNPTRQKDATQSLEDYMDPAATEAYLQFTHEQYYKAMPELFGSTILGFRGDEPDYSIAGLPWTPKFFDRFQQEKGYDIRPYLAAMLLTQGGGRPRPGQPAPPTPAKLTDAELRAKGDYYDVFSMMFRDGFFKPQALWCAAHGVEYQVHLNHEEMELDLTRSEGDFLRDMKYVEEPGIDAIWHQIWTDTISDYPRLASSAAHVYGHPQSFTESFAAYRPAPDITLARYILNEQLVRGINVMETMYYPSTATAQAAPPTAPSAAQAGAASMPANPTPPRGGPSEVMRDPGFPALAEYVRRVGYVMSMGRPAASVALYIPSSSMWLGDRDADTAFVATEQMLSERQIDFDIINLDALATDLKAGSGMLETMSGNQYRTVIVPSAMVLSQAELDRLKALVLGGGKVLFVGRTPSLIYGKNILDARSATVSDFSWATVETSAELPPTPTPPAQAPATPPSPQVVPTAIETALNKVIPTREISLDSADTALKVNTRRLKDANVYLFFNEGAKESTHTVTLMAEGKTAETWDPVNGTVSALSSTTGKGVIKVKIDLKPYETKLMTVK